MKLEVIKGQRGYAFDMIRNAETLELVAHSANPDLTALFAAAPEMLELLRKLAVGYDEDDGQGIYQRIDDFIDFTHEAQALIAKVEGGGE